MKMQEPFSQRNLSSRNIQPQDTQRNDSAVRPEAESHLQPLMDYQERVGAIQQQLTTLAKDSQSFETLTFGRITLSESGETIVIWGKSLENFTNGGFLTIGDKRESSTSLLENALQGRFSSKELSASEESLLKAFDAAEGDLALAERICRELLRSEQLNSIQ